MAMSARYPSSWWTTRSGDLMIRTAGAALLGLSWLAITLLTVLNRSGAGQNLPALGLAALGFVSGSAGAAALAVGRGLLERIETSARWQSRTAEIERRSDDGVVHPRICSRGATFSLR